MEVGIAMAISSEPASFDEQLAAFVELGIKKTFIAAKHPKHEEAMQKLTAAGITCETFHASVKGAKNGVPFEMKDLREDDGEKGDYMLELLLENIDSCARYGVPVLVVHGPGGRPQEPWPEIMTKRLDTLMKHAEDKGVKIAFENLSNAQNLLILLENIPNAGFCWDCGHQYCNTNDTRFMHHVGDRVIALHIHDNNCIRREDLHLIPYDGKVDYEEVAYDIAKSGYDGAMMLEISYGKDGRYVNNMDFKAFAKKAYDAATRIIERVEFYKKELAK
ncbi:MAG: sugar phosphate isomerase/epimerase [Ruminococcaceae bacterium]|nr:sugar phosphate isomerase/epimerase [Oscillospiraceae bacterium]